MRNKKKFIPVMLMPFRNDGVIDYAMLDQLIEFYIASGAQGLFANCLSSEMYNLSATEMITSVHHIVTRVDGRVPVVATGSFGDSLTDQASTVRAIYETGVTAVILITGLLAAEQDSDEIFRENVFELLRLTPDVPVGFYECPVPYKRIISSELLGELVKTGRVKYHKDTCLEIAKVKAKLAATQDDASFGLYDAYMVHALESLNAGAAGLSCIQGNYFPELVVWMCNHYNDTAVENLVTKVHTFFCENMELMHATYPASAKYVLQKRGLPIDDYCRNGSTVGSANVLIELDQLVLEAEALQGQLT